jgi:hypothetical protein
MVMRLVVVLAGIVAMAWSSRRWKQGVQIALVLVIFEGAIRKWLLPGAQDLFYFAKDVFLLGAYAGFFRSPAWRRYRVPSGQILYGLLIVGTFLGILQIFNPNLPNVLVGILGFKAYFLYVPLTFLLPAMFRSDQELAVQLRRYLLLALPVGLLAVAQFFSPPGSPLNTYARSSSEANAIVTFGSSTYVRVTSTFSFISGYTSYLLATIILLLIWMANARWRLRGNWLMIGALGATVLGMMMSGSRGPVLLLGALFPFYWWLGVLREQGGGTTFGRLLLGFSLLAGGLAWVGEDAIGAFYGRALGIEDVPARLTLPFEAPFRVIGDAGPLGFGIGATHQTAAAVTHGIPPYIWLRGLLLEAESGRVMLELGAIGFAIIYLIRIYLILFALSQVFKLRTRFHRSLAVGSFLFLLGSLPGGIVFEVVSGVYYWTFVGLLFAAMRLDQEAVWAAAAAQAASPRAAPVPAEQPTPVWRQRVV